MIFRRISYRIALQFTAFVFLLLIINGAIFLAADITNARRMSAGRLQRTLSLVLQEAQQAPGVVLTNAIPPPLRERIRILDAGGNVLYGGSVFDGLPFEPREGLSDATVQDDEYRILTSAILRGDHVAGFAQIAEVERLQFADLPRRALVYLLVSVIVSALTFLVGLFFAKSSLKPAEQMMERLEQFTQDASHELRTPLTALNSSLDLALRSQKYREGLLSAKDDVKQLTTFIDRLLELARLDQFVLTGEDIDFSLFVTETVEKYRALAQEKKLTMVSEVQEGIHVRGDPSLLRQVLGNLLTNAIKFTNAGGSIIVTLGKHTLKVADTGIGIPAEDARRIFDRFYQSDASRSQGGLGLGLALVKRILDLHRWTIGVDSTQGKGTTFEIRFPSHKERS